MKQRSVDVYAAYRVAGEMFGRLEAALGFGELILHKDARVFVFVWRFTAKGKPYSSQWFVDEVDIVMDRQGIDCAELIATRWKNEHRKLSA